MLRVIQGLRASVTDDSATEAITTLATMLKMWQKSRRAEALGIVRRCKIKWSEVLFKGAPTTLIKGKRNKPDQTVVRSPPKPSRSPWLSQAERSAIGEAFKDRWSALDTIRDRWVALSSEQQHQQFNTVVRAVQSHYSNLHRISSSVHAKLGKRKHWIEASCKEDGYNPKVKKDESQSFLLAAHFFKKDLTTLNPRIVKTFSPATYLRDISEEDATTYESLVPEEGTVRYSSVDFDESTYGEFYRLWRIWADMFKPRFAANAPPAVEANPAENVNIFATLEANASA
jgi:hypothetical protein